MIRTCKRLGIATVAVYSEADAETPHVSDADEAVLLGPAMAKDSYLDIAKVLAAINNARRYLELQAECGSFSDYLWSFVGGRPKQNVLRTAADYAATSPESDALSRDLRRRGFSFVGSTIVYAHMQAPGMVNDHTLDCFRREQIIAVNSR